jgi:transcriptional regulator
MYTPTYFKEERTDVLYRFIKDNSFGILITYDKNNNLHVTHINFFLEEKEGQAVLYGHIAQANPQAEYLDSNCKALAIFTGPHSYISPTWYKTNDVPTWNYTAVHAHGSIRVITNKEELKGVLDKLVSKYEQKNENSWSVPWHEDKFSAQLGGIVGFEIQVSRLVGKFKLSQNRSQEDRVNVIKQLGNSNNQTDRDVSSLMRCKL